MARISTYAIDTLDPNDKLHGTDQNGVTRNFQVGPVTGSGGGTTIVNYITECDTRALAWQWHNTDHANYGATKGTILGGSATTLNFSSTSSIVLSKFPHATATSSGAFLTAEQIINEYLNHRVIFSDVNNPNVYGVFEVTNISSPTSDGFITLTVTYVSGNGTWKSNPSNSTPPVADVYILEPWYDNPSGNNTTYDLSATGSGTITLTGSDSTTDNVVLTGGGGVNITRSNNTITIAHSDTSTQASSSNSGRTYIQDITLDTYGHVTAIETATETVTDTNTEYSAMTNTVLGLGKTAFSTIENQGVQDLVQNDFTNTRIYGIQKNSNDQLTVRVPWTDNNTTYNMMTSSVLGLGKLFSDTTQSTAANSITETSSRTYGIQKNSSNQLVVNVPWENTNTNTQNAYAVSIPASTTKLRLSGSGAAGNTTDDIEFVGSGATTVTRTNDSKFTISSTDTNTTYSMMTSSTLGLGKLFSDTTQTVSAGDPSSTASRTYGIQKNSSNQLVVNVPWTDTLSPSLEAGTGLTLNSQTFDVNTFGVSSVASASAATTDATTKWYGVMTDSDDKLVVRVPWTDTNTTYSMMTSSTLGLGKLFSDTVQGTSANSITEQSSRTYGIQRNSSNQLVVNVPWVDTNTNTTYSAMTNSVLGLGKTYHSTLNNDTVQTLGDITNRTYGIQKNSSNQLVVKVPWQNTEPTKTNVLAVLNDDLDANFTIGTNSNHTATFTGPVITDAPVTSSKHLTTKTYVDTFKQESFIIACSDETTALASTGVVATFRMPYKMTFDSCKASLTTAGASGDDGSLTTIDIKREGTTVFGDAKLTIDAGEKTSKTAATPFSASEDFLTDLGGVLSEDDEIQICIDGYNSGAKGLKVTILATQTT